MWRSICFLSLFLLLSVTCLAKESPSCIAQEVPWPEQYQGKVIPIISGDITISVPDDVIRVFYDEVGIGIQFKDNSIIGISHIDGDFYKSKQIPNGITPKNKVSVSFVGKIPHKYQSIPKNINKGDIDWQIWRYSIAMRSTIYNDGNIVKKIIRLPYEIYCYYSTNNEAPIVAEIYSNNENKYLIITGSNVPIEKFFKILGSIKSTE